MPKRRREIQVSTSQAFAAAALWFSVGAVPALLLALLFSALGNVGFFPPLLIFAPLFAGLGTMGLVAVSQEWAWFFKTPIARQWIGIFGESAGRVVLRIVLVFLLIVGVGVTLVPLIAPAKKDEGTDIAFNQPNPPRQNQPPANRPPNALNPDDMPGMPATAGLFAKDPGFVEKALKDLRSGKPDHQTTALSIIQATWQAGEGPAELRKGIARLLDANDPHLPGYAARALGALGTTDDVPALEKTLTRAKETQNFGLEVACKDAIEQIKKKQR